MSGPGEPAKPPSLGDLAAAAAFIVALTSAWLYAVGWTYAYHYFDRFGIPLLMLDLPREHYFVYGGVVMRQFPLWGLGIAAVGVLLVGVRRPLARLLGGFALALGVLAVLAVFWLGHQAAVATAHAQYRQQRESDYRAYPRVQVWTNETAAVPSSAPPPEDLAQGCYRLLLHNPDRVLLMRPFKSAPAAELPVLILPRDEISMIRVLPEYTSCW